VPLLRLILCFVAFALLNACYLAKSELLPTPNRLPLQL